MRRAPISGVGRVGADNMQTVTQASYMSRHPPLFYGVEGMNFPSRVCLLVLFFIGLSPGSPTPDATRQRVSRTLTTGAGYRQSGPHLLPGMAPGR